MIEERQRSLLSALKFIDPSQLSYDEWLSVGFALDYEGFPSSVWDQWSSRDSSRYKPLETLKKASGFKAKLKAVTGNTIFYLAQKQGWKNDALRNETMSNTPKQDRQIENLKSRLEKKHIEFSEPSEGWSQETDLAKYIKALFMPDEIIGYNTSATKQKGKWIPNNKGTFRTAGEILDQLEQGKPINEVIKGLNPEAGAWIRINPLDGRGCANANVTAYRHALIESDSLPVTDQLNLIYELKLPVSAIVFSGSKSIHAIVKIDAENKEQYDERVTFLYDILNRYGMQLDTANRNESRLSRMPGIIRGDHKQFLIAVKTGCSSYEEWERMVNGCVSLNEFHQLNYDGKPTSPYDYKILEYLKRTESLLVIGQQPYIYQHGVFRPDFGGTILKSKIQKCLYPQFIRSNIIERIYKLFLMDDEIAINADDVLTELNKYPKEWINFMNGFYDPVHRKMIPHSPKYRAINQIPHNFNQNEAVTGENITSWLEHIAPDRDDREMLLQFLGYCLTKDTRQQKFLILVGTGGSGKSTLIKMLESIVGANNISCISLKQITQRFAAYGLMGKLVNSCADLEIGALEDVSLIKKALGEDNISAEQKGKDGIKFTPYAKFIFSTNQLPLVLSETTNGFYRRLLILRMDRLPDKAKPNFLETLQEEQNFFIHLIVPALERMYANGTIVESENSLMAVKQLRNESDTVSAWLDDEMCLEDENEQRERSYLFNKYSAWCERNDRMPLKRPAFYRSCESKGLSKKTIHGTRYYRGISEKKPAPKTAQNCTHSDPATQSHDDPTLPF